VLVPIHVLANFLYGLVKKEPLITAMVTGRKPAADYLDAPEAAIIHRPTLRALVCLMVAAGVVFGVIYGLLGGKAL
jgi:hypothetical protein